jgi:hypothetical protein
MVPSGSGLKWNLDTARTGEVRFQGNIDGRSTNEKMGFSVSKDEVISRRLRLNESGQLNKEFTVAAIRGADALDLRFLAGGFKNIFGSTRTVLGSTEYRDPLYVSAPSSELLARAASFDFDRDPLFSELTDISVDLSRYSCSARPNISIVFDRERVDNDSFGSCDTKRLRRMNFCSGDGLIRQAINRHRIVCGP